eukprot:1229051-Rhodomonas_salina.4
MLHRQPHPLRVVPGKDVPVVACTQQPSGQRKGLDETGLSVLRLKRRGDHDRSGVWATGEGAVAMCVSAWCGGVGKLGSRRSRLCDAQHGGRAGDQGSGGRAQGGGRCERGRKGGAERQWAMGREGGRTREQDCARASNDETCCYQHALLLRAKQCEEEERGIRGEEGGRKGALGARKGALPVGTLKLMVPSQSGNFLK